MNARQLKRQRYLKRRAERREHAEHVKNVLFESVMRHTLQSTDVIEGIGYVREHGTDADGNLVIRRIP